MNQREEKKGENFGNMAKQYNHSKYNYIRTKRVHTRHGGMGLWLDSNININRKSYI